MPDLKKHCESCERKYGKSYEEVHRWMDELVEVMGPGHRMYRHDIRSTPNLIKKIWDEKFKKNPTDITGDEAREACLDHILLDTEVGDLPEVPPPSKEIKLCPVAEVSIKIEEKTKEKLENFLHTKNMLNELKRTAVRGERSLTIDFGSLLNFDSELAWQLLKHPDGFLPLAGRILEGNTQLPRFSLKIRNLGRTLSPRDVQMARVGEFIQVGGTLIRVGKSKIGVRKAVFKCESCGELTKLQVGEVLREPLVCENPNCGKKGQFSFERELSERYKWQSVRVQSKNGSGISFIDVLVKDDFVDEAWLGKLVRITGTLRVTSAKDGLRRVLLLNHFEKLPEKLDPEDEKKIQELAKDPWVRNLIIQSIAPHIYGHDVIKEAIALQLFGCNPVDLPDKNLIRGDIHILLVDDSGMASKLLRWVAGNAFQGFFHDLGTDGSSLSMSIARDDITGDFVAEAGAFVMASDGIICLNNFEKMNGKQIGGLPAFMDQQIIHVTKKGVKLTLNTRAAVLAAANPKYGRFEKNLTIAQQVPLDPVILSRFDLIFIMRDEPRADQDRTMAHHILEMHRAHTKVIKPPLDMDFLCKVIKYARKNLDPKLDDKETMKAIEDFFVDWRGVAERGEAPLPITERQLEALVRLAKANARMRLSDRVTVEDANRAINLVKLSLQEAGIDTETGKLDIDVLMTGKLKSQRDNIRRVLEIIAQLENEYGGAAPVEEIKRIAESEGIKQSFVKNLIKQEKYRGHLYEPKPGMVTRALK